MSIKIQKLRFIEHGSLAPKGSRLKGIVDTDSLVGFQEYTGRDESKQKEKEVDELNDGFFGYTTGHTEGTYTSAGYLKTSEDKREFKESIKKAFNKKGNLAWDQVISLESFEEAEKCGLNNVHDWNKITKKVLPKIFKDMKLKEDNMLWWCDYHSNTEHPHIHLVFLEKQQTRTKGKITERQLKLIKKYFYQELGARKDLEERVKKPYEEFFKEKDKDFQSLITSFDQELLQKKKIPLSKLNTILPSTGRLQYNSENMKECKPVIDKIISDAIKSNKKTQQQFDKWMLKIEVISSTVDYDKQKVSTIKEAELKKLYTQVGNMILETYKQKEEYQKTFVSKKGVEYKKTFKRKKLTKRSLDYSIQSTAAAQQREMEKSLDDFLRRYETSF